MSVKFSISKSATDKVAAAPEVTVEVAPEVDVPLTRFMVGTYVDPITNEWMLGYIKFNPVTKTLGEFKSERVSGDIEVMRDRLMIKQMQLGLFEAGPIKDDGNLEKLY